MFIIQCPIVWYAKVCALPSARSSYLCNPELRWIVCFVSCICNFEVFVPRLMSNTSFQIGSDANIPPHTESDLQWRRKVYPYVQVLHMHICVFMHDDRSPMSTHVIQCIGGCERCRCLSPPHPGGMTLFITVVMDSASLSGACASAVSERLSLCFTLTRAHRRTHITHCWNWQQRRAYPFVGE